MMCLYCKAMTRDIWRHLQCKNLSYNNCKVTLTVTVAFFQDENQFFRLYFIGINFLYCLYMYMLVFPQACRDFLDLAETHSRRWQRALQYEREQRTHLEETIEQLAKQHNSLERAWREAPTLVSSTPSATTTKGETDCVLLTPPLGLSV